MDDALGHELTLSACGHGGCRIAERPKELNPLETRKFVENKDKNGAIQFLIDNSLLLIIGAAVALVWANTYFESYEHVRHLLHFVVSDIGMAFFFLLAGKEIREAMLPGGSLSKFKTAGLPLLATFGGMAGPALIFYFGAKTFAPELTQGWAIPMATDIAFSYLVAKMIFGKSIGGKTPAPIVFLLLLAIADDAGGLIVLATFYPQGDPNYLMFALLVGASLGLALTMHKVWKVNNFWPYILGPGVISWIGFYLGGIHPALSLVPLCWFMPHEHSDLGIWAPGESDRKDTLNKMEHFFKVPVEWILLAFGFVNAGVQMSSIGTGTWLVLAGLLFGKPIGIIGMTLLGQKLGFNLPEGMNRRDLVVVGFAAAIGFTVALFVSIVAFKIPGPIQDSVKMGALLSFSAAIVTLVVAYALGVPARYKRMAKKAEEAAALRT